MELTKEKLEVKSLGLDQRVAYIGDLMIKMGDELACEAGFSGAAWECLKGYLVCKLFNIDELGGRILKYRDLLDPAKLDKIKSDYCRVKKDLAKEAERILFEEKDLADAQVDFLMEFIENARHI